MTEPRWCDMGKRAKLALLGEAGFEPAVIAAVEKFFRGRSMTSPTEVLNVALRESWRLEHGDTAEWDRVAAAGGLVIR